MSPARKRRIVSLLPSATEIICELGLGESLVGVTHECDHPAFVRDLPQVTRTHIPPDASSREIDSLVREMRQTSRSLYSLDAETVERLAPDLIVTQTLCDVCAVAEREVIAAAERIASRPAIVNLEPSSLTDVLQSLRTVADAAGVPERAEPAIARLQARLDAVASRAPDQANRPRVVFLEWLDPPFCAGHWTPELIQRAGGDERLGQADQRSRLLTWAEIAATRPEVIVLAPCGFTVERTLQEAPLLWREPLFASTPAALHNRVYLVDGSAYFNRPGPRLVNGLEIIAHAFHPDRQPLPPGLPAPTLLPRPT